MTYTGEETTLLWKCTRIRYHSKSIHLETVIVVEPKRLLYPYARIELEARSCKTVTRTRVAAVEDRHVVFLSHCIDSIEEREKVLLGINIFFTMSR